MGGERKEYVGLHTKAKTKVGVYGPVLLLHYG